jgi:acyl carrier protein
MSHSIEAKVKEILKANVKFEKSIDQIGLEDDLVAIGLNSIKFLKVIVALEETFDIEMDEEQLNIENFRTLNRLLATIENSL